MSNWYTSPTTATVPVSAKLSSNPLFATSINTFLADDDLTKQILKLSQEPTNFLTSHPVLIHQLIELITILPIPSDTDDRKFKYPMLACDILTRNQDILGELADVKEGKDRKQELNTCFDLLFKLFNEEGKPGVINSILPGYFQRVFQVLCRPRFYNKLLKFLMEKPHLLEQMMKFADSLSVVKCVLSLIAVDSKEDYQIKEIGKWVEFKKNILRLCVKELKETKDELVGENILVEVMKELVDKQEFIYHKKDLIPILFEGQSVDVYVKIGVENQFLRYQVLLLLNALTSHLLKLMDDEIPSYFLSYLTHLTQQLPQLLTLLSWSKPSLQINQVLQSLFLLLKLRHVLPCNLLISLPFNIFSNLWSLILSSLDSNILHNKFQKFILLIVDQGYDPLIKHCFESFNLISHILDYCLEKQSCHGFLVRVIESWLKQENYQIMEPYLKVNKGKMEEFTKSQKLFKYLKHCRMELGKINEVEMGEQKELVVTTYTVTKVIVERKEEPPIEGDCLEFGDKFELNFELNDPPSVLTPDSGQISMDSLSIPFNYSDGLSELSLQKNLSTTSNQSVPESVSSSKLTKQVSFQDFMKSKRQTITAEIQQKSKTPNKKSERQGSRSASKKKINKWGNNNNENVEPTSSLASSRTSQVSVSETQPVVREKENLFATTVYLPKVNIYQVPVNRGKMSKTMPQKERRLSPKRDSKLMNIMRAMREQGQLVQV